MTRHIGFLLLAFGFTMSLTGTHSAQATPGKASEAAVTGKSTFTLVQGRRQAIRGGGAGVGRAAPRVSGGFRGGPRYHGGYRHRAFGPRFGYGYGYGRRYYYGAPFVVAPFAYGAYAYDDGYYAYSGFGSCYARCRRFRGPGYCRRYARDYC